MIQVHPQPPTPNCHEVYPSFVDLQFSDLVDQVVSTECIDQHVNAPLNNLYRASMKQGRPFDDRPAHVEGPNVLNALAALPKTLQNLAIERTFASPEDLEARGLGFAKIARILLDSESTIEGVVFFGSSLRVVSERVNDIDCAVLLPYSGPDFFDPHETRFNLHETAVESILLRDPVLKEFNPSSLGLPSKDLEITIHAQYEGGLLPCVPNGPFLAFVRQGDRMGAFMNDAGLGFLQYKP